LLLSALLFLAGLLRGRAQGATPGRTRYREPVWERPEWLMTGVSVVVLAVEIAILAVDPGAFRYEPYPALTAPSINLVLLAAIGLLVTPAAIRP
jgi:peptidoglycan/LPS O-acetylase OafA/YrhL